MSGRAITTTLVGVGGDVISFPITAGVVAPVSLAPRSPAADLSSTASYSDDDSSDTSTSGDHSGRSAANARDDGYDHGGGGNDDDGYDDDDNDDSFREENAARPRSPSDSPRGRPSSVPPANNMARGDGPAAAAAAAAARGSRGRARDGIAVERKRRGGGRRHSMDGGPSRNAAARRRDGAPPSAAVVEANRKSPGGGGGNTSGRRSIHHTPEPQLMPSSVTPSSLPTLPMSIAVTNEDGHIDTKTIEVGITTITMELPVTSLAVTSSSMSSMATSSAIAASRYQVPSRAPSESVFGGGGGALTVNDMMVRPGQVAVVDTTENLFRLSGLTNNRVDVDALLAMHSDFLPYGVKMDQAATAAAAAAAAAAGVTPLALSAGTSPMTSHRGDHHNGNNGNNSNNISSGGSSGGIMHHNHNNHHSPGTHVTFAEDHPFAPSSTASVAMVASSSTPPISPQALSHSFGGHHSPLIISTSRREGAIVFGSRPSTAGTGTGTGSTTPIITTTTTAAQSASDVLTGTIGTGHMSTTTTTTTTTNAILITARSVKNFFTRSRSHSKVAPSVEQLAEAEAAAALRRKLTEAAYYVDCAIRGLSTVAESNSEANWRASKMHAQFNWFIRIVIAFYMLLPFLQRPSWCLSSPCAHYYTSNISSIPMNDLPLSNFPILDLQQGLSMELSCVAAITLHFLLHCTAVGWRSISHQWYFGGVLICATIAIVDIMTTMMIPTRGWRLSQLMRPLLFIARSPTLRTELSTIIRTVPAVAEIFALIVILLALGAWLGLLLFYQTPETTQYMPTFWMAVQNLLILLTTANFPDIMMPIYDQHRLSALFFVIFIFIGLYFLMPLVLASIFNNYQVQQGIAADAIRAMKRQALTKAYRALHHNPDSNLPLSLDICQKLLRHIERRSNAQLIGTSTTLAIDREREKEILRKLDADGDGNVSVNEFMEFASLIKLRVANDDQFTPFIVDWFPSLTFRARFEQLQRWTRHRRFHRVIVVVVVTHLILIITESAQVLSGNNVDNIGWFIAEWGYTAAYIAECLLKCLTSGWYRFWSRHHNKLAVFLTAANLAANILNANEPDEIRVVLLLRVARVLYVIDSIPQFEVIFSTFGKLVPQFQLVTGVLVATFYLWAEIGTLIFGGMVYSSNPLMLPTQYATSGYWVNSFNDFYSGLILLFELLVNNNWNVLMDGFVSITSNWARAFFISFYVFVALIVMNLVSALILNTFVDEWNKAKEKVASRRRAFLGTPSISLLHDDDDDDSTFMANTAAPPPLPAGDAIAMTPAAPSSVVHQQWAFQR